MGGLYHTSRMIEKKRQNLRKSLQNRHVSHVADVQVKLNILKDWTWYMKKKIAEEKQKEVRKADFKGFFNYSLDEEQRAACAAYMRKDEEIALGIENLIASGYSVKVAKANVGDGYQASLQCMDADSPNAGLVLSAFAAHWYDAIAVALFKHYECLGGVWKSDKPEKPKQIFG